MRFLVRLWASEVQRDRFLTTVRAIAKTTGAEARNPKWTSYGALELDIFCPTVPDFDLFIAAVSPLAKLEFVKDLNRAPEYKSEDEFFAESRALFNAERYWECHEVLEGIWRLKSGDEKRFLQGIILVCAAFVHHQKGEYGIALGVLNRAVIQLEFPATTYGGFDVATLRKNVDEILKKKQFSSFRV
jgi:hypothetical protein